MAGTPRGDGSRSLGPGAARGIQSQAFLKLVERTTDAFVSTDNATEEDVGRSLRQVRLQYDAVHHEAEQKDAQLRRLREEIRTFDALHGQRTDEVQRFTSACEALDKKFKETENEIQETRTSRKVYEHMLARLQKEQAILRQKMLKMEEHLIRKGREFRQQIDEHDRVHSDRVHRTRKLDMLEGDAEVERDHCRRARDAMEEELQRKKDANKHQAKFERWRHEVALVAANDAFNASAGRLRKLYAIEKLAGNCLQKITFEQVELSQSTEDGFQKIREVTGLADVMDIVHKFLNRELEHEQLRSSVKEAEVLLEALRQDFNASKRDTVGITFDASSKNRSGEIYKEIEQSERELNEAMEEHEVCRARLQKTTLQVEHMKRWTAKVGQLLAFLEEPVRVEGPTQLLAFFKKLRVAVEKFVSHVAEQIREGRVTRKALIQVMAKDNQEQCKILQNEQFLRSNCRVPATMDAGRPASRQGSAEEDDHNSSFSDERERLKKESDELARTALAEQLKKRTKA